MTDRIGSAADVPIRRLPWWVPLFSPIARRLLAAGVPLGFNGLITIRGRTSGLPRTTPVAIIEVSGRRWVWAPWGEVQWVRNLRAAGRATITFRRREGGGQRDRTGPDAAGRVLPRRPRSARARHPVRCLVHPHRRWGRSRRSGGSGRGSIGLRTSPDLITRARCPGPNASVPSPRAGSAPWRGEDRPSASAVRSPARPPSLELVNDVVRSARSGRDDDGLAVAVKIQDAHVVGLAGRLIPAATREAVFASVAACGVGVGCGIDVGVQGHRQCDPLALVAADGHVGRRRGLEVLERRQRVGQVVDRRARGQSPCRTTRRRAGRARDKSSPGPEDRELAVISP